MLITLKEFEALRQAQARGDLPSREKLKELSVWVKENWLDPVVSNIRLNARGNDALLKFLEHLRLDIKSHIEFDPESAVSYRSREYNIVDVSLMDIMKAQYFSKIGATFLVSSPPQSDLGHQIGWIYGQDLGAALAKGERPLWPHIDFKQLGLNPDYIEGLEDVSNDVLLHYITWLIFHEIGHFELKHVTDNEPESLGRAREKELKADLWAFERMNEIDYSLPILKGHLLALTMIEVIQSYAGQVVPESQSDHPSWNTRTQQLLDFLEKRQPARSRWIYLKRAGMGTDQRSGQQQFIRREILFPRDPKEIGSVLSFFFVNGEMTLIATEYGPAGAYLYARDPDGTRFLLHVKTPFAFSSEVDWYVAEGQRVRLAERFDMYRWSVAYVYEEERSGVKVRDLLRLSPREMFTQILHKVEKRPHVRSEVEKLLYDDMTDQGDLILRYLKGSLSLQHFDAEWKRLTLETQVRIKAKLGDENFKKYQKEIQENKAFQLGMDKYFSIINKK